MNFKFLKFIQILFFFLFLGSFSFAQPLPTVQVPKQPFSKTTPEYETPIPGWLGFATVNYKQGDKSYKYPWSPYHPMSHAGVQVVIFCDEATDCKEWDRVRGGLSLTAISSNGEKTKIQKAGISKENYGCEENKADMVYFVGPKKFPEGIVWIIPTDQAKNMTPLKIEKIEKHLMDDIQKRLINLYKPKEKFRTPRPIGAFQFGSDKILLVMWIPGYEGNSFPIFLIEKDRVTSIEAKYLYQCAY